MKTSELKSTVSKTQLITTRAGIKIYCRLDQDFIQQCILWSFLHVSNSPSLHDYPCNQKSKQMHFPASLMKLLCRGIYNNKKLSLKSKSLWEGMRVQVFSFTYRERRHYEISNLVKIYYPIFLCVNKMFPKLHKIHLQNSLMNIYLKFYKTTRFSCYSEIHI